MQNFSKVIELLKKEKGKVFLMDQKGDVQLVILGIEEYNLLRSGKKKVGKETVSRQSEIVDRINREILQAQLEADLTEKQKNHKTDFIQEMGSKVDMRSQVMATESGVEDSFGGPLIAPDEEESEEIATEFDNI